VPLKQDREFNAAELMEFYKTARAARGLPLRAAAPLSLTAAQLRAPAVDRTKS
jgi:hypothetical protein